MYKGLYDKFSNWFRGGNIWLYSDPHFSDEEMKYIRKNYIGDDEQIKRINSRVGKNDTIIFLGDIGNIDCIKKIRGYKVLIMGNHDKGATNYQKVVEFLPPVCPNCGGEVDYDSYTAHNCGMEYAWCEKCGTVKPIDRMEDNHLFDEVYEGPVFINDKIVLSHVPFDSFAFNIHGHKHDLPYKYDDKHLNMCAEAIDYLPVSLITLLKNGVASKIDSLNRTAIDRATEKKYNLSK